jgi:hypothetical protein
MAEAIEARRSSRIAARFWVAVEGVDAEPFPRVGDISATGIFFEVGGDVGDVGTVQWLHIASHDRTRTIHVMAHVVRVVSLSDVHRQVRGVALEFMPESDDAAAQLCDFVRYVLDRPHADGSPPHMAPRVEARAARQGAKEGPAKLTQLSVRTLLLETDWSVPVGEPIRVEIIARGVRRPVRVEGHTVSVLPAVGGEPGKRFRIAVAMKEEIVGPLRRFSSRELQAPDARMIADAVKEIGELREEVRAESPIEQLLSALIQPPQSPPEREHLSGLLSRIPFSALCSLLELERLTGEMRVRRGDAETTLYVRDGQFVDVTSSSTVNREPRLEIADLLECRDGTFELVIVPVTREDRIGRSMTQLLLDTAREVDESKRPAEDAI